jgi:hypothetical protein
MAVAEALDERQHRVNRRFVAADQHAAAAEIAQVLDRFLGFLGEPQQAVGVVAQEPAGLGQRGVLRGAVEQPLADALLQPPHGLADRRLRAVQLHRGLGEAPLGCNGEKNA